MTVLRAILSWGPLLAIAAELWEHGGPAAAACFAVIALTFRKHTVVMAVAAVVFVLFGHVWYGVVIGGAAYRLLWVALARRTVQAIGNRPVRPTSVVPRIQCRHGLRARIQAADELLKRGFGGVALDAYLTILADHHAGGCDRALYLRSAEAAVLVGDGSLAVELAGAVARDVRGAPVGRLATILARADGIRARGYLLIDDAVRAAQAIRAAQERTQADRGTDRFLRWTAAEIYLAGRAVKSLEDVSSDLAAALRQQRLTLRPNEALGRCMLSAGRRALDAGLPREAFRFAEKAAGMARLGGSLARAIAESEKGSIPRRRATAWRLYRDAVLLQVTAAPRIEGQPETLDDKVISRAVSAAARLDDPLVVARLMLEAARWSVRNGKPHAAAELLRRALGQGDRQVYVFNDAIRRANWAATRADSTALLAEIVGEPFAGRPEVTPAAPESQPPGTEAAVELFARLRQRDPDVFTSAHQRVLASSAPRLPGPAPAAALASGPTRPEAMSAARQQPKAVSARTEADAGPPWLHDLLASGPGARCWTVYQAYLLAQNLRHGHVGPEHLLSVMLAERPMNGLIAELAVPFDDLRAAVGARFGVTGGTPVPDSRLEPLLERAAAEAARWGEHRVRPAWLMLAMLREPGGSGAALLESYGVDRREFLVRLLATTVSASKPAQVPLFTVDSILGPGRLTVPARLVLASAASRAAEQASMLDVASIRTALQYSDWAAAAPRIADTGGHGEDVKITGSARAALRTALQLAGSRGSLGIGLGELRQAASASVGPRGEFSPAARSVIRTAHWRAVSQGRSYVQPADLGWGIEVEAAHDVQRQYFGAPPVLTPQSEHVIAAAERAAGCHVQVDDLTLALREKRAAR